MIRVYDHVPSVAMAVYAHPDDAEVACGASLAKLASLGTRVVMVVATQGDKVGGDPELAAVRRSKEMLAASRVLGVSDVVQLSYLDGELVNDSAFRERLVTLLRSFRPELVFAPDPTAIFFGDVYYNHRDHRELGWAFLDAAFPAAMQQGYFPASGAPLSSLEVLLSPTLEPNMSMIVDGFLDQKVGAIKKHRTQMEFVDEMIADTVLARARESAKLLGQGDTAELFRMVSGRVSTNAYS